MKMEFIVSLIFKPIGKYEIGNKCYRDNWLPFGEKRKARNLQSSLQEQIRLQREETLKCKI